jgi:hypothetical protein
MGVGLNLTWVSKDLNKGSSDSIYKGESARCSFNNRRKV